MNLVPGWFPGFLNAQGDPFYNQVVVLLHFDGADASTTIQDFSRFRRTFTASGAAQLDDAQKQFGPTSLLINADGAFVSTADSADFDLGTQNFTIEFWCRGSTTSSGLVSHSDSTFVDDSSFEIHGGKTTATVVGSFFSGVTTFSVETVTTLSSTVWYHVAITRSGTNLRIFLDGTLEATTAIGGASINTTPFAETFRVGDSPSFGVPSGHIDEVRFTIGTARYTASFTRPTNPFPNYAGSR